MDNGITSVGTTTGGGPELVVNGETGYIVEAGDVEGFADAMNKLISDKNKCKKMSKAAKIKLEEFFSSSETIKQQIKFFNHLLSENK